MSLEEALAFIDDDELLEVTPLNLRLRKAELSAAKQQAPLVTRVAPFDSHSNRRCPAVNAAGQRRFVQS